MPPLPPRITVLIDFVADAASDAAASLMMSAITFLLDIAMLIFCHLLRYLIAYILHLFSFYEITAPLILLLLFVDAFYHLIWFFF